MSGIVSQRWVWLGVVGLTVWGALLVMAPFATAIGWAVILTIVSWPYYQKVLHFFDKKSILATSVMTLLVALAVLLPATVVGIILAQELQNTYQQFDLAATLQQLTTVAQGIPAVGATLATALQKIDSTQLQTQSSKLLPALSTLGQQTLQGGLTFGLSLFTVAFLYYYGEMLNIALQQGLSRLGGESLRRLSDPLAQTVRGVMLGIVLTAVLQGILAGSAFLLLSIPGAPLWGLLVTGISLLQIPTLLIWVPCALWLGFKGQVVGMIFLLVWGQLIVVGMMNVIKAALISKGTGLPFYLMFCSVIGGVLAFGSLGIVFGPVVISLVIDLWRVWGTSAGESASTLELDGQKT